MHLIRQLQNPALNDIRKGDGRHALCPDQTRAGSSDSVALFDTRLARNAQFARSEEVAVFERPSQVEMTD